MPLRSPSIAKGRRAAYSQRPKSPQRSFESCTSLVCIAAEALRQQEYQRYTKRCRELDKATSSLRGFEQEVVPAFTRWMEAEFSAPLSELRRTEAELRDAQHLVSQVEDYADCYGVSLGVAYARIAEARAKGTEEQLWAEFDGEDESDPEGSAGDESGADFDDFARAFFGAFGDDEATSSGRKDRGAAGDSNAEAIKQQIKSVYHQLVRLLHPDTNSDVLDQRRWQAVQEAYALGDLERLLLLHRDLVQGQAAEVDVRSGPIGDIISLRKSVEARLRKLRSALREARHHPAWEFAKVRKTPRALRRFSQDLQAVFSHDLGEMKQYKVRIEAQIRSWERAVQRKQTRSAVKKPSSPGRGRGKREQGFAFDEA